VSVCGALASDVEALPILVGLGIRELSVAPGSIPRLKRRVRALDAGECGALATQALTMESAAAVRAMLRDRETMAPMNAKEAR
jgi:phosphoenolpyruvate-protein kinase (PTS system EI component)